MSLFLMRFILTVWQTVSNIPVSVCNSDGIDVTRQVRLDPPVICYMSACN